MGASRFRRSAGPIVCRRTTSSVCVPGTRPAPQPTVIGGRHDGPTDLLRRPHGSRATAGGSVGRRGCPPRCATARRTSRSATDRRCGSATARSGAAGTASRRRPAPRGRSSRSTTPSTAPASTTRARGGRPSPNCASPTWTATACATQVIFGPIFQISTDDPVLRAACYRVYNDWLLDFCTAAPDRLIGVPMLPENPEGALAGTRRGWRPRAACARSI